MAVAQARGGIARTQNAAKGTDTMLLVQLWRDRLGYFNSAR